MTGEPRKEVKILKMLMDEVPRTITEIAESVGISNTYAYNLCEKLANDGAIYLRKSGNIWIAWRKSIPLNPELASRQKDQTIKRKCLITNNSKL
ncbi:MAG: winged helix-turn-helix domain-containing protein [Promethearchaeota archaeon]